MSSLHILQAFQLDGILSEIEHLANTPLHHIFEWSVGNLTDF